MVGINKVTLQYNDRLIFDKVSFQINPGHKLGLVGNNGAGKSTLLKIITGEIQPGSGNISVPRDYSLGYLPQELPFYDGKTVWEEAESALSEIQELQKQLDKINHQLEVRTDYESDAYLKLIEDLNHYTERFNLIGGYSFHGRLERILLGLGFSNTDFERQTSEFSGGWRMRIELAKLLIAQNDMLLLDEPTNHLDIDSIIWLESFLKEFEGSIVMVSHDRTFLDNITNRTVEIVNGKVFDYPVPYSKFVALREERVQIQAQEQKNQEKEIKQTEQLIEKFRYKASKASFAQNLIKKLDKMERIEIDDQDQRKINFRFPPAPRAGKVVLKAEDLGKSYGDKKVFEKASLEINRGERVAFVGQNGQGKSTLVKIIAEGISHEGHLEMGHNVKIGYYAQEQAKTLEGDKTLLETIEEEAPEDLRKRARDYLGSFLFSGEDVEKKVKVLSGGEKGRLALCKLLLHPHNVLVMDEPTNHLDMKSKEHLKNALMQFDGTLVLVSHDRHFLQGLADKIYEFRDGKVREFLGDIDQYLESREFDDFRQVEQQEKKAAKAKDSPAPNKKEQRQEREAQRQLDKELQKTEKKVKDLEQSIEKLEAKVQEWDEKLQDPERFKKLSAEPDFYTRYEKEKEALEKTMEQWEEAQQRLEKLTVEKSAIES